MSFVILITDNSIGVFTLNGVLLSNIEKFISSLIIWDYNEKYFAI